MNALEGTFPHQAAATLISPRQLSVLALAAEGHTNGDIARHLGYAEVTIKSDLTALYRTLGAASRDDLIEKARLAAVRARTCGVP